MSRHDELSNDLEVLMTRSFAGSRTGGRLAAVPALSATVAQWLGGAHSRDIRDEHLARFLGKVATLMGPANGTALKLLFGLDPLVAGRSMAERRQIAGDEMDPPLTASTLAKRRYRQRFYDKVIVAIDLLLGDQLDTRLQVVDLPLPVVWSRDMEIVLSKLKSAMKGDDSRALLLRGIPGSGRRTAAVEVLRRLTTRRSFEVRCSDASVRHRDLLDILISVGVSMANRNCP